jgi:outer membrane biosynthesis protein TonB
VLWRRLVIALVAAGLAVTAGSVAVVLATVFMTPERPRPPAPTVIVAQATGAPRDAGPLIPTPTAAPTATPAPPTPAPVTPAAATPTATLPPASPPVPTRAPATLTAPPATPAPTLTPRPAPSPPATATPPPRPSPTRAPAPSPTPARPPAGRTPATATQPPRAAPLVLTATRLMLTPGQKAAIGVSYTGSGQIEWQATTDVSWLSVAPASGTLRGETDVLTVEARPAGLGAGVYQGRVIVTAGGGQALVEVTLRIGRP